MHAKTHTGLISNKNECRNCNIACGNHEVGFKELAESIVLFKNVEGGVIYFIFITSTVGTFLHTLE